MTDPAFEGKTVLFVGPTGPAPKHPAVRVLPPVKRGDVLALLPQRPKCIAIVDGYFGTTGAVLHKEILEALECNVPVLGAASMGALRAAELHPFGMIGIGKVFDWYRNGAITADDEVAVLHAPQELGYACMSVALVNLRATLVALRARGRVSARDEQRLIGAAAEIWFQERTIETIVENAGWKLQTNVGSTVLALLKENWIDQKRIDAEALFRCLSATLPLPTRAGINPTSWLTFHTHSSRRLNGGVPEELFKSVSRVYFDEFPQAHEKVLIDHKLAAFGGDTQHSASASTEMAISVADASRLATLRSRAQRALSKYRRRWPQVSQIEAAGAALKLLPGARLEDWLSVPPQPPIVSLHRLRDGSGLVPLALSLTAFKLLPVARTALLRAKEIMEGLALLRSRRIRRPAPKEVLSFFMAQRGMDSVAFQEFVEVRGFTEPNEFVDSYLRLYIYENLSHYVNHSTYGSIRE